MLKVLKIMRKHGIIAVKISFHQLTSIHEHNGQMKTEMELQNEKEIKNTV